MSLDKKYRPHRYEDVLGQQNHVKVLRQFVREGKGHQQSYLFAGPKGCGKTTLGRILARSLLCESPVEGEACDDCDSCRAMLEDPPAHECFTEMDAATNSGKEQVQQIVETQRYETFSGRRRVYLVDECFTEDTLLITPEGPRSIEDLVVSRYDGFVASLDLATGGKCWKHVTDWFAVPDERECVTLEFDNGVVLTVTTDQEVFTLNRGWVAAVALTDDDEICDVVNASLAKDSTL